MFLCRLLVFPYLINTKLDIAKIPSKIKGFGGFLEDFALK